MQQALLLVVATTSIDSETQNAYQYAKSNQVLDQYCS
jgi:hypothetical protein